MLCGVFGALPMTGVIVRSSANIEAGAKTRNSAILHGVWLLIMVAAFPAVLRLIPTASLAAILVYTGYKLVNPANVRQLATYGRSPVFIYCATLIGIVTTDLLKGVLIGVALTLVRLVYELTHFELRVESKPGSPRVDLFLSGSATFMGLPKLAAALDHIPPRSELHVHIQKLSHIDHACLDALAAWERHGERQGSTMKVEWNELVVMYERASIRPAALAAAAAGNTGSLISTSAGYDAFDASPVDGMVALSAREYAEAQGGGAAFTKGGSGNGAESEPGAAGESRKPKPSILAGSGAPRSGM
jgi:MFS superfamily sulfate permease-like transporter